MKINAAWHKKNKMPPNPPIKKRILWHKEHAKHCACRQIPEKLAQLINKYV